MHILIKTDTGKLEILNTDDISKVEGNETNFAKVYLKTFPDFAIRIGCNIRDFYKVLNGEDFFQFCKLDGFYAEHTDGSELKKSGKLKDGVASEEDLEQVKAEFAVGLDTTPAELDATKKKAPSFSKKKKKDAEKKLAEEKPAATGSVW